MRRYAHRVRITWLCTALLQLALPGAAAWADARLDAAGMHAKRHVESHSTTACVRMHPADCALCRFLTTPLSTARPIAVAAVAAGTTAPATGVQVEGPARPARLLPPSRAPPPLA
jgi:hypothetical protein